MESKIREFLALINKQNYTGNGMGDATHVNTLLFKYYLALDDLKTYKSEANKLRHLRGIINMGGGLKEPYHISVWKTDADKTISEIMSLGIEVDFSQWTTRLVNDENDFKKTNKNDSATISSVTTDSRGCNGGSSGGGSSTHNFDKSTYEPLNWKINGINATVFYNSIGKVNDDGKFLPKVTKEWFTKHPNAKCRQKFKDTAKEVTSSSKYRNLKKKRERKIAAAAAARAAVAMMSCALCHPID